ncbi:MAG: ADP-forming succinate--CoA ligase subunit beta [Candidatus Delongbacteria bacterium]|nr:ADP-forming succinate--CoA ligase subunit beta [Candidatus Delongbacteria bacterium]
MKIHEFQGKEILKHHGIPLPESLLAHFPDEAWMHSMVIGYPCMLKSQVLSGGRGKAGGVKKCTQADEVRQLAKTMFENAFVSHQSGPQSLVVRKLLVEKCIEIKKEFYFSMVMDVEIQSPLMMASPQGGVDIEETSISHPERIIRIPVNPYTGILAFHIRELLDFLGIGKDDNGYYEFFHKIYQVFMKYDCTMLEINPLVLDQNDTLIPVDVKMDIDENALFRQPEIIKLRDLTEYDQLEIEARLSGLNFIKLSGNVGCMVNGAGLAMATMDFIKMAGAQPANFLDVGGVATSEMITRGLEILIKDPSIRMIFINIFGGIVRCDKVAEGITTAVRNLKIEIPIIVRLSGSKVDEGMRLLKKSEFRFNIVQAVEEASEMIRSIVSESQKGDQ